MTQNTLGMKPKRVALTDQQRQMLIDALRAGAVGARDHVEKERRPAATARLALADVTGKQGPVYSEWETKASDLQIVQELAYHIIADLMISLRHGRLDDEIAAINEHILGGRLPTVDSD